MPNIHLSPDEKEYILKNANLIPTRKIAEYIGCSQCAIQYLLRKHGRYGPSNKRKYSSLSAQAITPYRILPTWWE